MTGQSDNELRAENERLKKINRALMDRVERSMDQQGLAFSLFETATNLESQINRRTQELTATLAQLKRSNNELQTAKNMAEKANISKTHFLAAASHDVLQPLNAARLLISSLQHVQSTKEGNRLCEQIESSLETMSTLLRTLLYMSRLDSGDIKPDWSCVCLSTLFNSIASDFQPMAEKKSLQIRLNHNHLCVHSDATMLRRIVQNMVANAINYTDSGGILIAANQIHDAVQIRVADTGRGIAREDYENIFIEFHRQAPISDEQCTGLGLGLAIVAQLISILNHRIEVNSILHRGSCFKLSLLTSETNSTPPPEQEKTNTTAIDSNGSKHLNNAKVLLVENDLDILEAMHTLLKQWGCESRLASSTQEALEVISGDQWPPDIIVADQHLDANDTGTSCIELVRALAGLSIPAVIITANPSKPLTLLIEHANIELMLKPVKPGQLRALLTHLLAQRTA